MVLQQSRAARVAAALLLATLCGCSGVRNLAKEISGQPWEQNLSIRFENNLPILPSTSINGFTGRFSLATALPTTVIDTEFAAGAGIEGQLRVRVTFRELDTSFVRAELLDMDGVVDAMIGADALGPVLVVDFPRRVLTRVRTLAVSDALEIHEWEIVPSLPVTIDGVGYDAIVDTMNPDTIHVPAGILGLSSGARKGINLKIGQLDSAPVEALATSGDRIRLGNLVLKDLLIGIDYNARLIAVWDLDGPFDRP
ncbi:MAG: hypothetical protein KY459_04515 [Acidobacteria bacterium]|nr:hypothetical protein [Acidobacteriota bacterium]